jgi:DNA replication and repair protein RecF
MQIEHLSLKNFRNYSRLEKTVPAGAVLIHGENAQGKTSLLEAIYYVATSTSPYATSDKQLINWRTENDPLPFAQVGVEVMDTRRSINRLEITIVRENPNTYNERFKKEIRLNGVSKKRSEILGMIAVVMFLPQDLALVEGSPTARRAYMNATLSQVDSDYDEAVTTYDKVLTSRNALLKQIGDSPKRVGELDYWDHQLTQAAGVIIAGRQKFLREIEIEAARIYRDLTGGREDLRLAYVPSFEPTAEGNGQLSFAIPGLDLHRQIPADEIAPQFQAALLEVRKEEVRRGMTLSGPQRDEMRLFVNERDLSLYGSRGQARTAVMAIKLAELQWMRHKIGEWPVLLLDEVISELDASRRAYLLEQVKDAPQALLTTTEPGIFTQDFLDHATLWQVTAGQIVMDIGA